MHHTREASRLAVVAPTDRFVAIEGKESRHLPSPDRFAHVVPVVCGRSLRPLVVALRSMRLHAVAALPFGEVTKGDVIKEMLVGGQQPTAHVANLDRADLAQALQLGASSWIHRQPQPLQLGLRLRLDQVLWRGRQAGREYESGAQDEPPGSDLDDFRLLSRLALEVDPADAGPWLELAFWLEPVVPLAPARANESSPDRIGLDTHMDRAR